MAEKVWIKPKFDDSDGKRRSILREPVDAREALRSGSYELVEDAAQVADTADEVDEVSVAAQRRESARKAKAAEKS